MMATFNVTLKDKDVLDKVRDMMAFELGYKMCEKGYNLEMAKVEFRKLSSLNQNKTEEGR